MANYNNIIQRIQAAIPEFTNTSASSIWRRMAAVFSSVIDIVQLEITRSETIIESTARNLRAMGKQYYIDTAFAYQEGDALTVVDNATLREGYAVIDASKHIIKQAAVSITSIGQIYVRVATVDASNNLVPLTSEQVKAFKSYMQHFTPLGMEITVSSQTPDVFNATNLYIRYLSEYSLTAIQNSIVQTLQQFQTAFNPNVPVFINDVETAIKQIEGIRDVWFTGVAATYTDSSGQHTTTPVNGTLLLNAGYFNFNPAIYEWESGITVFEVV